MNRHRKSDAILIVSDYLDNPYIPYTSDFLDERTQAELIPILNRSGRQYLFDGGFKDAARKVLMLVPDYEDINDKQPPIAAIVFDKPCSLNHRQVLGKLLSLGVSRDVIGDISIWEDKVQIIVHERMLDYFLSNFTSIRAHSIKPIALPYSQIMPYVAQYDTFTTTVASNRLDAVLSRVFNMSRTKASQAIKQGLVTRNYLPASKSTTPIQSGDIISMRRKGKIKIGEIGTRTKKGRIRFRYFRYK